MTYRRTRGRADAYSFLITKLAPPISWTCEHLRGGHVPDRTGNACVRCGTPIKQK